MVILATFVLLFFMTGSVLIPIKALIMNVLSLGAALGVLVWVFQDGNGESLLGFSSTGRHRGLHPDLVFALGFGLARWTTRCSCFADQGVQGRRNEQR